MHQRPMPPPPPPLPLPRPRLPGGSPDGRPPPIWPHLTPGHQRQLAQVVAELLRRARCQQQEGRHDDAHDVR
jgi:hypothetical protein